MVVPLPIEDYALIGDMQTAGLVGRDGSMDWLCLPRFDSGACFAALLGGPEHGRWIVRPADPQARATRRYLDHSLVLETIWNTREGSVRVLDFMPPRDGLPNVVRLVEGIDGRVPMRSELVMRFDYGGIVPWGRRLDGRLIGVAGPDALFFDTPVDHRGEGLSTVAEWSAETGDRIPFVLTWCDSYKAEPETTDPVAALDQTERFWDQWCRRGSVSGPDRDAVMRSLVTLKALTYAPTGGIVAAPTTSLPEQLGGVRNWDYRYCWVRDAALTLVALLEAGYTQEAGAWRDWLLRAVAGEPAHMQIMYGPAGERRLSEYEVDWLPGYEGAAPVRIGNAASEQFQLDVYGEVMDTLHHSRTRGLEADQHAWDIQLALLEFLEGNWKEPDEGIWEVRGGRRHFTHSKVMAWVAFDRAVQAIEVSGREGPADRWRAARKAIHDEVCDRGFNAEKGSFTQSYDRPELDAALLLIPRVGFLPIDDERVVGTVEAVQRELVHDGFVLRYEAGKDSADGLPPGEGAFLPCSFWLVDDLALLGRRDEARTLFDRLLDLRNDVGLLAEEYDPTAKRLVGNFPQAFSHVGLVNSAFSLQEATP